ncbi:MAG: hypothetical protein HQK78_11335 [Desulfobacterales bacterium]|nr:hypothetical protein [Desulfobacterales bacterium]
MCVSIYFRRLANFIPTCNIDIVVGIIDCKIEENLLKEAIYFKTKYRISVADSIALSLAKVNNAIIITSDHHEFDCIDKAKEIDFYWFR